MRGTLVRFLLARGFADWEYGFVCSFYLSIWEMAIGWDPDGDFVGGVKWVLSDYGQFSCFGKVDTVWISNVEFPPHYP